MQDNMPNEESALLESALLESAMLESAMRRAFDLARRGPAHDINPQVGSVIVDRSGRIVAEGWHLGAGTRHAETDALAHIPAELLEHTDELTAVVTLEPCNHTGNTGPCSLALIEAGIGRVVYAMDDPGDTSSGGAKRLRDAGVEVLGGVLAAEARVLLAGWLARQNYNTIALPTRDDSRPYVIAKWAQTLDGRAVAADGSSKWITGPEARAHVHAERALVDGILVGTGTLLADNPALTARNEAGDLLVAANKQPVPIIFGDSTVPHSNLVFNHPALQEHGLNEPLRISPKRLKADLKSIKTQGISSIYIEGGPKTINTWLKEGLVDELHIYVAPKILGGPGLALQDIGIETISAALNLRNTSVVKLGKDMLVVARNINESELNCLPDS